MNKEMTEWKKENVNERLPLRRRRMEKRGVIATQKTKKRRWY